MSKFNVRAYVDRDFWQDRVRLRVAVFDAQVVQEFRVDHEGSAAVVETPIGTVTHSSGDLLLTDEAAQHLMNDLYAAGIRPTVELYRDGEAKAKEAHLADLRRILDKVLPVALNVAQE